eukprot:8118401-Lingulodinium_polyedra.AAC.1
MELGPASTVEGHICKIYSSMTLQLPSLASDEPTKEVLIIDIRRRPSFGTLSALPDIVTVPLRHTSQA